MKTKKARSNKRNGKRNKKNIYERQTRQKCYAHKMQWNATNYKGQTRPKHQQNASNEQAVRRNTSHTTRIYPP